MLKLLFSTYWGYVYTTIMYEKRKSFSFVFFIDNNIRKTIPIHTNLWKLLEMLYYACQARSWHAHII